MKKLLLLAFLVPACVVGSDGGQQPPGDDDGSGSDPGPGSGISGSISADQTWTGTVDITGAVTIESGATVTVMAGTTVNFANGTGITVKGALDVQGVKGSEVQLVPATGATHFQSINVQGTLTMTYAIQHGGGVLTVTGGTTTITDSMMYDASGDYMVMNGGTVNIMYSQLGADVGTSDATHCNMHFGGVGNNISVTHSRIVGQPYAIMLYGGQAADLSLNNWEIGATSSTDWVDSAPQTSADFSGSYFAGGYVPTAKAGATFTFNNPANAPLLDAGIR